MSFSSQSRFTPPAGQNPLSPQNFRFLRDLLKAEAAIHLDDGKEYLVENRLAELAEKRGFASADGLLEHCRITGAVPREVQDQMIDALTTNETLFFRDLHPFDALRSEVIPELMEARAATRRLRIWSAACSTGQEAYSIAMLLEENFPALQTWRVEIVGTDLSNRVIERARQAHYQQFEVNRGLPAKLLIRFFKQNAGTWMLDESIRRRVQFSQLNLVKRWPPMGEFDLIFLRNVLIYFEVDVRKQILGQIRNVLAPGGYLALGNAETAVTLDPAFKPTQRGRATFFQLR